MATVFLGYKRTAYDRLSASWKVLSRTNIQVTQCHHAETVTKVVTWEFDFFMKMHPCTSHWLLSKLCDCECVQLNHPAYSPDLAPSDHFLIRNLKYRLCGTWFIDDESLKLAVKAWSERQKRKFYF